MSAIRGERDSRKPRRPRFAVSAIRGDRDLRRPGFAVSAIRGERDSRRPAFAETGFTVGAIRENRGDRDSR